MVPQGWVRQVQSNPSLKVDGFDQTYVCGVNSKADEIMCFLKYSYKGESFEKNMCNIFWKKLVKNWYLP